MKYEPSLRYAWQQYRRFQVDALNTMTQSRKAERLTSGFIALTVAFGMAAAGVQEYGLHGERAQQQEKGVDHEIRLYGVRTEVQKMLDVLQLPPVGGTIAAADKHFNDVYVAVDKKLPALVSSLLKDTHLSEVEAEKLLQPLKDRGVSVPAFDGRDVCIGMGKKDNPDALKACMTKQQENHAVFRSTWMAWAIGGGVLTLLASSGSFRLLRRFAVKVNAWDAQETDAYNAYVTRMARTTEEKIHDGIEKPVAVPKRLVLQPPKKKA